ncbi:MAG: PH domain-containing protein [Micromonosporaceae bacterium]|nr:PH domain-containing protein [Micromonosporaceae bacterium]
MTAPPPAPPPADPAGTADPAGSADTAYLGIAPVPGPRVPESLPPIDPSELAGLQPLDAPAAAVRRVSPLQEPPSDLIARYLFPTERFRGEWRRHLIHLSTPITVGVLATVGFGLLAGYVEAWSGRGPRDLAWVPPLTVLAWLVVLAWVGWRVAEWHFDRFILTNKRVMVVSGIVTRHVAMMPLARVTDMKYEQTPTARLLNYGTFVLESAGQDQALREIPHLPNPNELYLRVVEEMYEPHAVEQRLDGGEDREDQLGDA